MNPREGFAAATPPLAALTEDRLAFRRWYDDVVPLVYRYLRSRCGHDEGLARELTRQTFSEAIRYRDRFDGRSDAVDWLTAIGRAKLIDHYRRAQAGRGDADYHAPDRTAQAPGYQRDERRHVEGALDALPGDQRLALVFRYLDGFSVADLGAALGRSQTDAHMLLFRAREAFRRAYEGWFDG